MTTAPAPHPAPTRNGARTLLHALVGAGVDVCFANPGTSEMYAVAALDDEPGMRGILCLFEGVATGAADGYGRMTGRPACTLLHTGPGLANGLANLHNARRARTPLVNVVGDHARFHKPYDSPLESDIEGFADPVSGWVRRVRDARALAAETAEAVARARDGQVTTLIVPADLTWESAAPTAAYAAEEPAGGTAVLAGAEAAARALGSGEPAAILLGGAATRARGLRAAARIAAATGARLLCESFPARLERGGGLPVAERLAYLPESADAQLAGVRHLVLAGAASPVTFFGYPGRSSDLVPEGCEVHPLDGPTVQALEALADALAPHIPVPVPPAPARPVPPAPARPTLPTGPLTAATAGAAIGALLPEAAIVVDEANTSGLHLHAATAGAPRHDWLTLTGGAIGQGLPVATGAAVACPDRPVVCLEADGSAMYTLQALWTQAREQLNVTTVVFDNAAYAILGLELRKAAPDAATPRAGALLDLSSPRLDFVALAEGMGVPAARATTAEEFTALLRRALTEPGPFLIDCVVPSAV
ncbi:acetolactate synthase large subunit [Streptomyces gamaensis]|uniref:Acetolactate synthase large subunit n=1 Tax=Streptomyces gamaensis TaxID=1763542 RepID=A0ABW0YZ34_9ACTN